MAELVLDRTVLAKRGRKLEYFTISWGTLEAIVALLAGVHANSISLVGFGLDSWIEVASGAALLWRMSVDAEARRRQQIERSTLRIVGACFFALAIYVIYEAVGDLAHKRAAGYSLPGIILAVCSVAVMAFLSRAKRQVAVRLKSSAMKADAKQSEFCMYLSLILLAGLLLHSWFGIWWADPVASLGMVPMIVKEGVEGFRGEDCCG